VHRLHRVRFVVDWARVTRGGAEYEYVWARETRGGVDLALCESYSERCVLVDVTPVALEKCRLDLEDVVKPHGGVVSRLEVLWHSHFRRRKGRQYHPCRRPRGTKERARRRRELMLRDKQRILDRCSTTEHD
jgi:hypothetical protein